MLPSNSPWVSLGVSFYFQLFVNYSSCRFEIYFHFSGALNKILYNVCNVNGVSDRILQLQASIRFTLRYRNG